MVFSDTLMVGLLQFLTRSKNTQLPFKKKRHFLMATKNDKNH